MAVLTDELWLWMYYTGCTDSGCTDRWTVAVLTDCGCTFRLVVLTDCGCTDRFVDVLTVCGCTDRLQLYGQSVAVLTDELWLLPTDCGCTTLAVLTVDILTDGLWLY